MDWYIKDLCKTGVPTTIPVLENISRKSISMYKGTHIPEIKVVCMCHLFRKKHTKNEVKKTHICWLYFYFTLPLLIILSLASIKKNIHAWTIVWVQLWSMHPATPTHIFVTILRPTKHIRLLIKTQQTLSCTFVVGLTQSIQHRNNVQSGTSFIPYNSYSTISMTSHVKYDIKWLPYVM